MQSRDVRRCYCDPRQASPGQTIFYYFLAVEVLYNNKMSLYLLKLR